MSGLQKSLLLTTGSARLPALSPSYGDSGVCTHMQGVRGLGGRGAGASPKVSVSPCCRGPLELPTWVFLQHLTPWPLSPALHLSPFFFLPRIQQSPEEVGSVLPHPV